VCVIIKLEQSCGGVLAVTREMSSEALQHIRLGHLQLRTVPEATQTAMNQLCFT
jgi:hypothetical protein